MSMPHDPTGLDTQGTPCQDGRADVPTPAPDGLAPSSAAAPGTPALGHTISTAASALIVRVLGRQREQWRRSADDVKSALGNLERACETAGAWHPADVGKDVSDLVSGVVAAAKAEASAAAERARAEASAAIDDLQARLRRFEAESIDLRDTLVHATARQQDEHRLRLQAEAAWAESQRMHDEVVASYQSQLQAARLDVETERQHFATLRQQLTASLEMALRAVQGDDAGRTPGPAIADTPRWDDAASHELHDGRANGREIEVPARPHHGLTLVATAPESAPAATPEMVAHVTLLLEEAERKYDADIAANMPPLDVVDRLTENLRLARAQLADGAEGSADCVAALFKEHLTTLLDARAECAFGRHLGISVHELYPIASATTEAARRAS